MTANRSTDVTRSRTPSQRDLWRSRDWRWTFVAAVLSRLGDVVFDLTVVLWISTQLAAGQSWAPAAVSGVLICAAAPVLLVAPLAGVVVDRTDRRRVLLLSNLVQAVTVGSLVPLAAGGLGLGVQAQLVWVYAVVLVSNSAGQFFQQARIAMIAATVQPELRARATSAQMGATSVLGVLGPALSAPLFFGAGAQWAIGVNAVSFVLSSQCLRRVRWDAQPTPGSRDLTFGQSFLEGLRVVRGSRVLVVLTGALAVAGLGSGMINVLEVFFVTDVLRVDASHVALLLSAFAVGTILGAVIAPHVDDRLGSRSAFVLGLALCGLLLSLYSRATSLTVAVVLILASAIPLAVVNTVMFPMILAAVEPSVLGRATVILTAVPTAMSLGSMAAAGWLVSGPLVGLDLDLGFTRVGGVDGAFLLAGVLFVLTAALAGRCLPRSDVLRPEPEPGPSPPGDPAAPAGAHCSGHAGRTR